MKKYKEWLTNEIEIMESETSENYPHEQMVEREVVLNLIDQLDEPEVLSQEWISDHIIFNEKEDAEYIYADNLQNLLVPKQEEVDRAYKDGYEKGKEHTFYKGYLEGLADKEKEPETVASVIADFYKSFERFREVISMEVEEFEE